MYSILKGLGLTIWGLIAVGLLAILLIVGYQAAIKYRSSIRTLVNESTGEDEYGKVGASVDFTVAPTAPLPDLVSGTAPSATPNEARQIARCDPSRTKPRVAPNPVQLAQIDQLLNKTDAAKAGSGGPLVKLGQLYYGFGEYDSAIASIRLGLKKGSVARLDDAYVYLGLSEQAVGDLEAARVAFDNLKEVPGISPKVVRLWALYADTQLKMPEKAVCPE